MLAVVVVAQASVGVVRLNGVFERAVLEVFGAPGTAATITFVDIDAHRSASTLSFRGP